MQEIILNAPDDATLSADLVAAGGELVWPTGEGYDLMVVGEILERPAEFDDSDRVVVPPSYLPGVFASVLAVPDLADRLAAGLAGRSTVIVDERPANMPVRAGYTPTVPASLAERRAGRLAELAAYRYEVQTGGVEVAPGVIVRTDAESLALISGARELARVEPGELVEFKAATGWISIDGATMEAVAVAAGRHVRDCFRRERALAAELEAAGTVAELDAVNIVTGWPT